MATRVLSRDSSLSPAARESLATIERNVRLEARFIDDLLDLTRNEHGKLEISRAPVHLHEVLRDAVEVTLPDLQAKEQQVEVALVDAEDLVLGDAIRLQQAFWNLLKNGSKFSPADTSIYLRSRHAPASPTDDGNAIIVEVTDEGIGFEPAFAAQIFEAWTQASREITRSFGGLGLGLSICRASIQAHGGSIQAISPGPQKGATFTVTLPLHADAEAP